MDIKIEGGVGIVSDITKANYANDYSGQFALTLCTNMLEHVENIEQAVNSIYSCTVADGYILLTVPFKYKKHLDPIDNMFRSKSIEIYNLFNKGTVEIIAADIITITDKKYYPIKKSKYPLWSYRNRIAYWMGKRHQVSGILLKAKKDVRHNRNL